MTRATAPPPLADCNLRARVELEARHRTRHHPPFTLHIAHGGRRLRQEKSPRLICLSPLTTQYIQDYAASRLCYVLNHAEENLPLTPEDKFYIGEDYKRQARRRALLIHSGPNRGETMLRVAGRGRRGSVVLRRRACLVSCSFGQVLEVMSAEQLIDVILCGPKGALK